MILPDRAVAEPLPDHTDLESPAHRYWDAPLQDRFTRLAAEFVAGDLQLDSSSELAFLNSLLDALGIPVSSQTLVFSTTSLQLRFISPENPRAIYFSDDVYVGYIPGGRIEVVSIDPALGGIYYIFDVPPAGGRPRVERSRRCMNCHAEDISGGVPGLQIKSVVPGRRGGSLDSFRRDDSGHGVPMDERFGGWYVTGDRGAGRHWGNLIGNMRRGEIETEPVEPGERFDWSRYPVATSDLLAHLLHEHQVGFVNRAVEATYKTRTYLAAAGGGDLGEAASDELDRQAHGLVRYLLFADEVPLPGGGIEGDPEFRRAFLEGRRPNAAGRSLRDLDLRDRLFRYRCSYMVYSAAFTGLPDEMKRRVVRGLVSALAPQGTPEFSYLSLSEKEVIRSILSETLEGLPAVR